MSYRQALKVSWALTLEMFWWTAVVGLPLVMVIVILRQFQSGSDSLQSIQNILIAIWIVINFFFILPLGIGDVLARSYDDFRIAVRASVKRRKRMTYMETLQLSFLAMLLYAGPAFCCSLLHLNGIFLILQLPLLIFFVFPTMAAVAVRVPMLGFRLFVIPAQAL